jgi:(p)ppGpp synthase/HD superfamily hydrolase
MAVVRAVSRVLRRCVGIRRKTVHSPTVDSELVRAACALAERAHAGQRRKARGVPYFTHLAAVAQLVVEHGYDDDVTVAAAYLHDLLED